jgi:hypothetical protein
VNRDLVLLTTLASVLSRALRRGPYEYPIAVQQASHAFDDLEVRAFGVLVNHVKRLRLSLGTRTRTSVRRFLRGATPTPLA